MFVVRVYKVFFFFRIFRLFFCWIAELRHSIASAIIRFNFLIKTWQQIALIQQDGLINIIFFHCFSTTGPNNFIMCHWHSSFFWQWILGTYSFVKWFLHSSNVSFCWIFLFHFLFFLCIWVIIVNDTCITFLSAFIINLAIFSISIFLFFIWGIDNIATPQLLMQSLIFIFE